MHLKIISFLLLVSLLSGCGNESSPPSAANDSIQETLEETKKTMREKYVQKKWKNH